LGRLSGKVAFITGGGSGIGRGIAERFAAEGARIAILEIDAAYVAEAARAFGPAGDAAIVRCGDVTRLDDIRAIIAEIAARWGRLDVLVNNAGVTTEPPTGLLDLDPGEWRRVIDVNLNGAYLCTREAVPAMRDSGGGSILNITSISARGAYPGRGAYAASKAALETLTLQSAVEFGPWKVRANGLSLGWFRTPLNEHVYQSPGELERRNATIPIGRIGSIDDAAHLAVFLASDESTYLTGESIELDGGLHAAGLRSSAELARIRKP
jgi:3-oxoacyl-[acyl-carrier protein] reductase